MCSRRVAPAAALAAVIVGLALALVVPPGTAEAAEASSSTVQTFSPGTSSVAGTPVVPPSVIVDPAGTAGSGYVGSMVGSVLWYGDSSASQSIMNVGFEGLTTSGKITNTGIGYITTSPYCKAVFSMDATDWGISVPYHRVSSVLKQLTQAQCAQIALTGYIECYSATSTGSAKWKSVSVTTGTGTNQAGEGPAITPCSSLGSDYVPVVFRVDPTTGGNLGSDGGWWVNPAYEAMFAAGVALKMTKTCQSSTGATQTVSAVGAGGTGVVPDIACPAGTFPVGQKVEALYPDGSVLALLSNQTLASNALTNYAACLGLGLVCDLSVWIDGVRCALLLQDCDKWNDPASVDPSRVQCKWGNYVMPASDCAPLTNCYGVPIDSINNGVAGAQTGCGTDPDGPLWNGPLTPIQDGKLKPSMDDPTTSPSAGPTGPTGPPGDDGSDGTDGQDGSPAPQPTINVTVNPTINVTVHPTVNVTVNAPNQGPVDIPQGQDGSDCWPSGSAKYNPLDWAYTPMHCAMSKLFMPTPGKAEGLLGLADDQQPFKAWTDTVSQIGGAFSVSAGGCQGPAMPLGYPFYKTLYPASSCDEPMATIAKISRAGTGGLMIIGGLWSGLAAILQGIGYQVRSEGSE